MPNPHPDALMNEKLLPCPFCGGKPVIVKGFQAFEDCEIQCPECFMSGPGNDEHGNEEGAYEFNRAKAIHHWNRRVVTYKHAALEKVAGEMAEALKRFIPREEVLNAMRQVYEANKHQCAPGVLSDIDAAIEALTSYRSFIEEKGK